MSLVTCTVVIARNIIVGMLVELQGTPHLESGGCGTLHHGWSVDVGWTYSPDVGCGTTLDVGLEY